MQTVSGGDFLVGNGITAQAVGDSESVVSLLVRLNQQNDLLLALLIVVIISVCAYAFLRYFTRF